MEELKRTWFKIVWAGLLLVSLALSYIQRYANAAWAQGHTMEVLQNVLGWIVLPMTVVLFVLHCIECWRTGERYFWRSCRRWGGNLFFGALMAAVLVFLVKFLKSGVVFEQNPDNEWFLTLLFVIFSLGGLLYMVARYKFKHPKKS